MLEIIKNNSYFITLHSEKGAFLMQKIKGVSKMGLCEVLTIIFVLCKLFDVVTWSWWIVFLPGIIAVALYIITWVCCIAGSIKAEKWIDKL